MDFFIQVRIILISILSRTKHYRASSSIKSSLIKSLLLRFQCHSVFANLWYLLIMPLCNLFFIILLIITSFTVTAKVAVRVFLYFVPNKGLHIVMYIL